MSNVQFASILGLIVSEVVRIIVEKNGVSETEAVYDFYKSDVFSLLQEKSTKVWHFSPLTLYHMYIQEKECGSFDMPVEG